MEATLCGSNGGNTVCLARHRPAYKYNCVIPCVADLQEESYFVGRVVCEVEGGVLNDTAVVLEGDSFISEGARVHLDLSHLSSYRLFPGQVIILGSTQSDASSVTSRYPSMYLLVMDW